jgi:ABC-type nitrate/sulfonate/bicarbonate transport system substrate-binding protein
LPRSGSNHLSSSSRHGPIRVGFVPLIDAAPLIVAGELGYFGDEGLDVTLERQLGWANVRDKLAFGHLDASHAVLGLPLASVLPGGAPDDARGDELVSVMSLSSGGNAITVSARLAAAGVNSAATLARFVRDPHGDRRPLVFAHVFGSSTHHYLLRDWLDGAGVDPDLDVRLCVIPPPMTAQHLAAGHLDGFAVGEPWNTLADRTGVGQVVCPTTDLVPGHPEKVLVATRRWAAGRGAEVLAPLIRATLRGCAFCSDPNNGGALAELLAQPRHVGVDAEILRASLSVDRSFGLNPRLASGVRPADWVMRSFAPDRTFPSRTHVAWLLEQMIRWGHAPADADLVAVAERCTDSTAYRKAAESLGIPAPPDEWPPMRLRGGRTFDARQAANV